MTMFFLFISDQFLSRYSLLSLDVDSAKHERLLLTWQKMLLSEVHSKILIGMSLCILLKGVATIFLMLKLVLEQFSSTF